MWDGRWKWRRLFGMMTGLERPELGECEVSAAGVVGGPSPDKPLQ